MLLLSEAEAANDWKCEWKVLVIVSMRLERKSSLLGSGVKIDLNSGFMVEVDLKLLKIGNFLRLQAYLFSFKSDRKRPEIFIAWSLITQLEIL